jgi:ParB family chromosome partitioning protein
MVSVGGQVQTGEQADDEDDTIRPLPDRLVSELTAERTLALRDALANAPDAAFLALLHALCLSVFRSHVRGIEAAPWHPGCILPCRPRHHAHQ